MMHGAVDVSLHIWPLCLIAPPQQFCCQQEKGRGMCLSDRPMMGADQYTSACRTLVGLLMSATPPPVFEVGELKFHALSEAHEYVYVWPPYANRPMVYQVY